MLNRRDCMALGAASFLVPACTTSQNGEPHVIVNDVHAQLNATRVARIARPNGLEALADAMRMAEIEGKAVSVSGSRHAMGGQQFAADSLLLDMRSMNRIVSLDRVAGTVEVQAGIEWPELIDDLAALQQRELQAWSIIQKQTGADRLTLGGALAANAHGRAFPDGFWCC